ncbi:EF-hand domain-containing protein [Sphingomonas sp. Tas61C01]|uniref:EF-hand domain-containing protein n=1 Tax=Sphingomonas sp. Tas61C01 TaxID=3458297 RepID=UPI00403E731C
MKNISVIMLGRMGLALAVLSPTAACAQPAGQNAPAKRDTTAHATGIHLATFISRHEKKLLADDTDGDGKVSRAEFLAAAKAGKQDPAKRFAKFDANSDGILEKWEINATLSHRFKRQDTNGDGLLNATERTAAHARKGKTASDVLES